MDKGIRPAAIVKFNAALPSRVNTREGNTVFRKSIIAALEEEFGCTHAAGATHYNYAFIEARKAAATNPELATLLVGLGRPEDKKGGRKPKAKAEAAPTTPSVIPTDPNALLQNFIKAGAVPGAMITHAASQVGLEGLQQGEAPQGEDTGGEEQSDDVPPQGDAAETPAVTLYTVFKVVKGTDVATDLTEAQAAELIAKAAAAKKSKLDKRAQ